MEKNNQQNSRVEVQTSATANIKPAVEKARVKIDEAGETVRQSSDKLYENVSKTLNPDGTNPESNSSAALNQDVGISKKIF